MIKRFLLFVFSIILIPYANAGVVATIGDKSVVINKSTSCDLKKWRSNQTNACGCCLTKEKMTTSEKSDEIVRVCIKEKLCTLKALSELAPGESSPDDILTEVIWSNVDTPTITVDPKFLTKNGKLRAETFPDFLANLRKDLRDLTEPLSSDFSRPKCLKAEDKGSGGANTAQLFVVKLDEKCLLGQPSKGIFVPKYIVKETKKKTEEIRNLRQLHLSELRKSYDLLSPNRSKDKLAISFDGLNIKYYFKNSSHYLTFLTIAPGKSLMSLSKDLALSIKKGDTVAEQKNSDRLYNAFYALGKALGELHKHFMDKTNKNKLLGNSIVHGDLHLENVYADVDNDYLITLIDNESFAKSLKEKRPVAVDLFVLYAFTIAQYKSEYLYPKEISLTKWNNVMLKAFLLGYMSNWPVTRHIQLLNELKEIFTNPMMAFKLLDQRFVFVKSITYRAKLKDIKRVFDDISKVIKEKNS